MTHPRKAIRNAVRDRLGTANAAGVFPTAAKDTVFASRIAPVTDDDYPAILIYSREDKNYSEPIDEAMAWRKSTLMLVVQGMVRALDNVDDKLDDLSEEIETAIDGWAIPGFESAEITLIESDVDVVTEGVRKPIGAIGLTYSIVYRAPRERSPSTTAADDTEAFLNGDDLSPTWRGAQP